MLSTTCLLREQPHEWPCRCWLHSHQHQRLDSTGLGVAGGGCVFGIDCLVYTQKYTLVICVFQVVVHPFRFLQSRVGPSFVCPVGEYRRIKTLNLILLSEVTCPRSLGRASSTSLLSTTPLKFVPDVISSGTMHSPMLFARFKLFCISQSSLP